MPSRERGAPARYRFVAQWQSPRAVCRVILGLGATADAARDVALRCLAHSGTPDGPFLWRKGPPWRKGRICVLPLARGLAAGVAPARLATGR